jgi:iron complex transport system substrate-binding protein
VRIFGATLLLLFLAGSAAASGPPPVRRIVSLAPHLTELVFSAGAGERLVGVVSYSDYPPAARELPRVGDAFSVDFETVVALRPDLVLAWEGGNPGPIIERLRSLGLRVETFAPVELDDVARHLRRIGSLTGNESEADRAAGEYLRTLDRLRARYSGKRPVRVFYQVSSEPLYTVGGRSYISQIIDLCGGRNIFAGLKELAAVVSLEAVLTRDPELIIAGTNSAGALSDQWARWPGVSAVAAGNLEVVDSSLTARASVRLMDGAGKVCEALESARISLGYSVPSR